MSNFDFPSESPISDKEGRITLPWAQWFTRAQKLLGVVQARGTTANRPTTGLYEGRFYFDQTLNLPIWVKTVSPVVWIDAAGNTV